MANMERYNEALGRVGNRFQFTVLLQKRVRELVKGANPLVRVESKSTGPIDIALQEFLEGKISSEEQETTGKEKKK